MTFNRRKRGQKNFAKYHTLRKYPKTRRIPVYAKVSILSIRLKKFSFNQLQHRENPIKSGIFRTFRKV